MKDQEEFFDLFQVIVPFLYVFREHKNVPFLYVLRGYKNLPFLCVFKEYKNGTSDWNGLKTAILKQLCSQISSRISSRKTMASLIFVATAPLHPSDLKELLTYFFTRWELQWKMLTILQHFLKWEKPLTPLETNLQLHTSALLITYHNILPPHDNEGIFFHIIFKTFNVL